MFFAEDRIRVVRRMILSKDKKHRQAALDDLLPYQRNDFEGILEAMDGLPVTVRLLDPPLHEFLPKAEQVDAAFAAEVLTHSLLLTHSYSLTLTHSLTPTHSLLLPY